MYNETRHFPPPSFFVLKLFPCLFVFFCIRTFNIIPLLVSNKNKIKQILTTCTTNTKYVNFDAWKYSFTPLQIPVNSHIQLCTALHLLRHNFTSFSCEALKIKFNEVAIILVVVRKYDQHVHYFTEKSMSIYIIFRNT